MTSTFIKFCKVGAGESKDYYEERVTEAAQHLTVNALKSVLEKNMGFEGKLKGKLKADLITAIVKIKTKENFPSESMATLPKTTQDKTITESASRKRKAAEKSHPAEVDGNANLGQSANSAASGKPGKRNPPAFL